MARMQAPESGVTVRMYRQGLGDCFLLAFAGANKKPFYMLIDCGVILGTPDPQTIMTEVAEDIAEATGGDIHLLAVTHEHWDHVSGFLQARAVFERLRIHNLWFAWTEDPKDELANRLREQFSKDLDGLRLALSRAVDTQAMTHIDNLLGFFGDSPTALAAAGGNLGGDLGARGRLSTGDALKTVQEMAKKEGTEPEYRRPGEGPLPLPKAKGITSVPGVRIYVLGPPHDERTLRRINPTVKGKEVYHEGVAVTGRTAFLMAVQDEKTLSTADREMRDLSFPFDERLRVPVKDAKDMPFFQDHYGFDDRLPAASPVPAPQPAVAGAGPEEAPEDPKEGPKPAAPRHPGWWRRIDDDWLGAAGEIALQLDSYTNNTSLAMAIELIDTGKVLLFVADAQVGNWLSWDNLTWTVKEGRQTKEVKTSDLLERTVLYKVGHHGSHNATVRGLGDEPRGLELMSHPDLVALVPVDHEMAVKKRWGKMPFDPLVKRLKEKCAGRVFRIDDPFPREDRPEGMSEAAWRLFKKDFHETGLYMEYTVRM